MRIACFLAIPGLVAACVEADDLAASVTESDATLDLAAKLANVACDLDAQLAYRIGGDAEVDCASAQVIDAVRCVLDASAGKRTFKLVTERGAFVGGPQLNAVITSDAAGLHTTTCSVLSLRPGCTPSASDLCLYCPTPIELSIDCAIAPRDDCKEAGNYSDGDELHCCPGLREVSQRAKTFSDDSNATCVDGPLRLHACIEGSCGDGKCEPEEAVACGCELDCPIAD